MTMWIVRTLTLSLVVLSTVANAQAVGHSHTLSEDVDTIVAPYLAAGDFMGVIGIMQDEEVALLRSYGFASVEQAVPNKNDGIFMIGSISKQFTAAAILLLEEQGALKTSDFVEKHIPEFPHGETVTIEQLATHTAGIADTYSLSSFGASAGLHGEFATVVKELCEAPLTHPPGEAYAYSNGGYLLLAAVIESASGELYDDFLRQKFFEPLGMENTEGGAHGGTVNGRVYGYHPFGVDDLSPQYPQATAYSKGPGSIWSTAEDLMRWADALHSGRVLGRKAYAKLTTDYGAEYGYGVSIFERLDRPVVGHDGRVSGFASDLATYLDEHASIVVLSNVESVARDEIRYQVAAAYFGEPYSIPATRRVLDAKPNRNSLVGTYTFGPYLDVTIRIIDDRLMARANQGAYSELVFSGGEKWFSRMLYTEVCFRPNDGAVIDRIVWGCGEVDPIGYRVANN